MHVDGGRAIIAATSLTGNVAAARGGAVHVNAGVLVLSNRTHASRNVAGASGAAAYAVAGTLTYELPSPLGRWIASEHILEPNIGLHALVCGSPQAS